MNAKNKNKETHIQAYHSKTVENQSQNLKRSQSIHVPFTGIILWQMAKSSTGKTETRRQWNNVLMFLKENSCKLNIQYPDIDALKKMKIFSDKQRTKELAANWMPII